MIQGKPSNETLAKVLHLLSTSHDFREQMLGDPVAALKPHGIEVDPSGVPASRKLPSMAETAKIHQQFLADPQDRVCVQVFIVLGAN